ncbi:MAG: HlyD family efflux transporter periplasmic adaptor subunit [Bacteroidota bacterium]|nr:HlyD family efflux transporter periplasmic adaptor subunit [Bacteroidota bacterium]
MNIREWLYYIIFSLLLFTGCIQKSLEEKENPDAVTPVTITNIKFEPIEETFELNAITIYNKKSTLRSNATGTIEYLDINPGDHIRKGQVLFTIKTKEAAALSGINIKSDTSFSFKGIIKVKAIKDGIVSTISHHKGEYVQEGDELAVIADPESIVFLLQVPYEMTKYIKSGQSCRISLPDNRNITAKITSKMPAMDIQSQTENYILKPEEDEKLPENLIARASIIKSIKKDTPILPKAAVLSNESQTEFWVMKLINKNTAVKVKIKKGIENTDKIEILEPAFSESDKIILTGNYGLADTAKVSIKQNKE